MFRTERTVKQCEMLIRWKNKDKDKDKCEKSSGQKQSSSKKKRKFGREGGNLVCVDGAVDVSSFN